jgi:hypothetical protein
MSVKSNHSKPLEISFSINTNELNDDINAGINNNNKNLYMNEKTSSSGVGKTKIMDYENSPSNRSSSFKEDVINDACLAEEEDSTISGRSSILMISSLHLNNNLNNKLTTTDENAG